MTDLIKFGWKGIPRDGVQFRRVIPQRTFGRVREGGSDVDDVTDCVLEMMRREKTERERRGTSLDSL